jgi:tetratricopeptide (TPR) repeat protein
MPYRKSITVLLGSVVVLLILYMLSEWKGSGKVNQEFHPMRDDRDTTVLADRLNHNFTHHYLQRADSFLAVYEYDSALARYNEASVRFKIEKNWRGYTWSLINAYDIYCLRGEDAHKKYVAVLDDAFAACKEHLGENHPFTATTHLYYGLFYFRENMLEESLTNYEKALRIRQEYFPENSPYIANVLNSIGRVYAYLKFDHSTAEKYFEKALKIREKILPANSSALVDGYYNLAVVNQDKGDDEKAISLLYAALNKADSLRHGKEEWYELLYGEIGSVHHRLGQIELAEDYLKKAIRINTYIKGDRKYLALYCNALGRVFMDRVMYDSAVRYFRLAKAVFSVGTYRDSQRLAISDFYLGDAFTQQQRYDSSITYYRSALALSKHLYGPKHRKVANIYRAMAFSFKEAGLIDSATDNIQKALIAAVPSFNERSILTTPEYHTLRDHNHLADLFSERGVILKSMYVHTNRLEYLRGALSNFYLADSLKMSAYHAFDWESSKLQFVSNSIKLYDEAMDCVFRLYTLTKDDAYLGDALFFLKKSKSRVLQEKMFARTMLANLRLDSLLTAEKQLEKNRFFLQSRIEDERNSDNPDEKALRVLYGELARNEKQCRKLREYISAKDPAYYNLKYHAGRVKTNHMIEYSSEDDRAVIEYFWGEHAIYVFGVYGNNVSFIRVDKKQDTERKIERLVHLLSKGYDIDTKRSDYQSFCYYSHSVFSMLVRPVFDSIGFDYLGAHERRPAVTIIHDGPLATIPFETLLTRSIDAEDVNYQALQYLLKSVDVKYDYSIPAGPRSRTSLFPGGTDVLAFGFSNPKESEAKGMLNVFRSTGLSDLPGSGNEIRSIAGYFDGSFFTGTEATELNFKNRASEYDIIHLSLHGESDSLNTYNARIIFRSSEGSSEDGVLHWYEAQDVKLNCRLVVLSACEAGKGRIVKGEGAYSMGRAFSAAGSPSVVVTLWKISDLTSGKLMERFYEQLSMGEPIDKALTEAKLGYLESADQRLAHPAFWAAYVAVGEARPVTNPINLYLVLMTTLLIPALVFASIRYWKKQLRRRYSRSV